MSLEPYCSILIFHFVMQICSVEHSHQGRFTCRVETSTDTEKAEMSIDSYVRSSGEEHFKALL